jgi:hypothetical protein
MSYSQVTRQWGEIPRTQVPECIALQKSSDGAQKIEFNGAQEVYIRFRTDAKWTIAEDLTDATAKFSAGEYNKVDEGEAGSVYFESAKSIFVLNLIDSEVAEAIDIVRYTY